MSHVLQHSIEHSGFFVIGLRVGDGYDTSLYNLTQCFNALFYLLWYAVKSTVYN